MTDRIDELYPEGREPTKEQDNYSIFLSGPAEYLAKKVAKLIKEEPKWHKIFGEAVESYERMDFSMRDFPALRIYEKGYTKQYDSWFVEGDLFIDIILPDSLRRDQLQFIQDSLSSALVQQFRRPSFFTDLEAVVPGLNEIGKTVVVDKALGFEFSDDVIVPLTQIRVNFRIDLRIWDKFLEEDLRTKDDPFERTLGDLERVVTVIQGLRDSEEVEKEIGIDQNIEE